MAMTLRMQTGAGEASRSFSPAHDIGTFWPALVAHALVRAIDGSMPEPIRKYLTDHARSPTQLVPAMVSLVRACERMLDPALGEDRLRALAMTGFEDFPPEVRMAVLAQVGVVSLGGWLSSALITTEAGTLSQELAAVVGMGNAIMDRYFSSDPNGGLRGPSSDANPAPAGPPAAGLDGPAAPVS